MMIIDAHQHFWNPATGWYGWLGGADERLRRRFDFADLAPSLARHQVAGTVLVQAADSDDDTDAMFAVAATHSEVLGVVAYLALEQPERAAARLAELQTKERFVGVRSLIHDRPDPNWLRRDDVAEGLGLLEDHDVSFDLVTSGPEHLAQLEYLSMRFPGLRIVLDHLGTPPVGLDPKGPQALTWARQLKVAASNPLVSAKVSGLYPRLNGSVEVAATGTPPFGPTLIRPWIEQALALFGPDRLMFGSDWPVAEVVGGYDPVVGALRAVLASYGPKLAAQLLGGTALSVYRLDSPES